MSDEPERFLGLDVETTGTDARRHGLVQVGAYSEEENLLFVSDVNPGYVDADPEAMKIHGLSFERIQSAPSTREVDERLARWLKERCPNPARLHAVGFNVASFDLVFLRKFLPRSWSRLSYRTLDLNALLFALRLSGQSLDKQAVKCEAQRRVARRVPGAPRWHDAGYDAMAATFVLDILLERIGTPAAEATMQEAGSLLVTARIELEKRQPKLSLLEQEFLSSLREFFRTHPELGDSK